MLTHTHHMLRRRPYEIRESERRPEGAEHRHWQQATDELDGQGAQEWLNDRDYDDRYQAALLQGTGECDDIVPALQKRLNWKGQSSSSHGTSPSPDVGMGACKKPARRKVKQPEGA